MASGTRDEPSDQRPDDAPTFAQYAAVRRYQSTLAVSPDGRDVAYSTNISGQYNIWRQPTPGGYARQVTLLDDQTVRTVAWSPDGATLVFVADRNGDEFGHVYRISPTVVWCASSSGRTACGRRLPPSRSRRMVHGCS